MVCREKSVRGEIVVHAHTAFLNTGCTQPGDNCPPITTLCGHYIPHSLISLCLTRFKTEFCSRGSSCSRPFCFFAHSDSEIRVFDSSVLSSPMARKALSIAEGTDFKRRHTSPPDRGNTPLVSQPIACRDGSLRMLNGVCVCLTQINHPFGAMDVGLTGQNIWSIGPCDLSRTSNMCGMSTISSDIGATRTSPLLTGEVIPAAPLSSRLTLWNHGNPLSSFESGQGRSPTSDLDSNQRSKISWPELNRQALNEYLSIEALTALYMLLPPSDK